VTDSAGTRDSLGDDEKARLRQLLDAIEDGLAEAVPGLVVVDRDLEVAPGRTVDLVGVDAARRPVFVLLVGGDGTGAAGEESLLSVAATLVFARRHKSLLGRHWRVDPPPRLDLEPAVVLVSDTFEREALDRLALLGGVDLRLFEVREVKSEAGHRIYLVPGTVGAGAPGREPTLDDFLSGLPGDLADTARTLIGRVERVDDGLERRVAPNGVHWSFEGRASGSLLWVDGRLEGGVPGSGGLRSEPRIVRGAPDVDDFVEAVLVRHLGHLRLDRASAQASADPGSGSTGGLGERLPLSGELLTPEELEAFREA